MQELVFTMHPVPDVPTFASQRSEGSGAAKRARRNALPQTFFMLCPRPDSRGKQLAGLMTIDSLHTFVLDDSTRPQYHELLTLKHSLDPNNDCSWRVSNVVSFLDGPILLESHELKHAGGLVAEMLTAAGV